MGKWSDLPVDLLNVIDDDLVVYKDKVRVRAVCVAWNIYLPKLPNKQAKQLPWLFHPLDDNTAATHGLFNPVDEQVYRISLPEVQGMLYKGSSHGWVVTVERINSSSPIDINLINPLTGDRIALPPRTEFPDVLEYRPNEKDEEFFVRQYFDKSSLTVHDPDFDPEADKRYSGSYVMCVQVPLKALLSSAPGDDKCVVVAIYGHAGYLAWWKPNAKKWTHCSGLSAVIDIMFHKSKLYAVTRFGYLFVLEKFGSDVNLKVTKISSRIPVPNAGWGCYLALCSDGSLLVVARHFDLKRTATHHIRTKGFTVYKLVHSCLKKNKKLAHSGTTLTEVKDIGGDVLFLGSFSSSRLISSDDLSGLSGLKGNRIYFTDGVHLQGKECNDKKTNADMGIFNLEDGTIEPIPSLRQPVWPRPIWINVD